MTSEGSPSPGSLPVAAEGGSVQRRGVRRRLIQTTLFPQRPEEAEEEAEPVEVNFGGENAGFEESVAAVVVEEGDCGPSLKKRSKGKGKAVKETSTLRWSSSVRKPKQHLNSSTPSKNGTSNSRKCGLVPKMLDLNEVDDGLSSQPIPDLRMEAKTAAEENSRLFAGKQIHPFFVSRRSEKKSQGIVENEVQEHCACDDGDSQCTSIGPIHVFEKNQEDYHQILDWGHLTFDAETLYSDRCSLDGGAFSSIFRGNIRSLTFDSFNSKSNAFDTSPMPNVSSPIDVSDVPHADSKIPNEAKLDQYGMFPAERIVKFDNAPGNRFLEDSVQTYYVGRGSCIPNTMWTDKYEPRSSSEVCGNHESVKFLSEWLHQWHGSNRERKEGVNGSQNRCSQPSKCSQDQSDSDSDGREVEVQLKNVMLITGPVGCGKSAAVYACAKEQGFEVMEVNASECRNGAVVKQKFGEALESRWLKRLSGNQGDSQMNSKAHPELENNKYELDTNSEEIEILRASDGENSNEHEELVLSSDSGKVEVKRLILFEDVDITFIEDRGFISSIQQIAETAKGPIIMTSNNSDLVLPENLERHHIYFSMPSAKELLYHLHKICLAEKASIQHHLLEKFVGDCGGDIRKVILHLQFWCQGTGWQRDGILRSYGPSLSDLESCHRVIPKLMPWDCHSKLSELVEKNISESLCLVEQAYSSKEVIEESVHEEMEHPTEISQIDRNLETKKEEMLRRNCSSYEDLLAVQAAMECRTTNSPGSPLTFYHIRSNRKLGILMSSDSEDEDFHDKDTSLLPGAGTEIKTVVFSPGKVIQNCLSPPCEELHAWEELNKEKCLFPCSNRQGNINFDEPLESLDISRVPESTYVPETEIVDAGEPSTGGFCCNYTGMGDVSPGEWSIQDLSHVKWGGRPLSRLRRLSDMEKASCGATVSPHIEAEDIHVEHRRDFLGGWKVMDECSRIEFNGRHKHDTSSQPGPNLVEQSWSRLRIDQQLKEYVNAEQPDASQSIELAHKMADLISEADLLLYRCQEEMEDYREPATIWDEPESFSWCDDQWQMASTFVQHGVCSYAQNVDAIASNKGLESTSDLASEMLVLARNKNAAAKLTIPSLRGCIGLQQEMLEKSNPLDTVLCGRESKKSLFDVVESIIPRKRYLCIRGDAFHEYISFLGCISKAECYRLSKGTDNNKRRRGRRARHYLSSGVLMLTPEDLSLLCTHCTYGKDTVLTQVLGMD
ncbi:hypothetical protein MLD38_034072 [Melastoma candidum]|uniref:Uncharacterized protein n=1 Tax=Melastoma candidum TaxID=119954 RepID=A0ACB9MCM9_9MYRT|nr:hypothetical protein MLD38_034072 [Melastoma candidum]